MRLTQKMVQDIVTFYTYSQQRLQIDYAIFDLYESNVLPHLKLMLTNDLSDRAMKEAFKRSTPINILKQVTKKLSTIYNDTPTRVMSTKNKKLVDVYSENCDLDNDFKSANELYNVQRRCAIKPIIKDGKPDFRVLPAHKFLVYNSITQDDSTPDYDVFIEIIGRKRYTVLNEYNKSETKWFDILHIYTDQSHCVIDTRPNKVYHIKENAYGVIPFHYINMSKYKNMPSPNEDDYQNSLQPLVTICDLNYALKYMSHSILYTINVNSENIEIAPDMLVGLESTRDEDGTEKKPEIGSIKPNVNIPDALQLLATTMKMYLESKGLKVNDGSKINSGNAMSGVQEMIQQSSLTDNRKGQVLFFSSFEQEFWKKQALLHNIWYERKKLKGKFNKKFSDNVDIKTVFPEQQIVMSRKELVDIISVELKAGLTTVKKAVTELNPTLSEIEIDNLVKEIKAEIEERSKKGIEIKDANGNNDYNERVAEEAASIDE